MQPKAGTFFYSFCFLAALILSASAPGNRLVLAAATMPPDGVGRPVVVTADSLRDAAVVDTQGRTLGTAKAVELDLSSGSIAYVIVQPGTRDRLIPVPFSAFLLTPDSRLVLDISPGRLLGAPSYAMNSRANWSSREWLNSISRFWLSGAAVERGGSAGFARGGGAEPQ